MPEEDNAPEWAQELEERREGFAIERDSIDNKIKNLNDLMLILADLEEHGEVIVDCNLVASEGPGDALRVELDATIDEVAEEIGALAKLSNTELGVSYSETIEKYEVSCLMEFH